MFVSLERRPGPANGNDLTADRTGPRTRDDATTCRHEFARSRFPNLCGDVVVGSRRCAVCRGRIWKFWKTRTCVDCGVKKHKSCYFTNGNGVARSAAASARAASPELNIESPPTSSKAKVDEAVPREPSADALLASARDVSRGATERPTSPERRAVPVDTTPGPLETAGDAPETLQVAVKGLDRLEVEDLDRLEVEDLDRLEIDGITTPAALDPEVDETTGVIKAVGEVRDADGNVKPTCPERRDDRVSATLGPVETSRASEDDKTESPDSVVRQTCPEQSVRVTTPASLEVEAVKGVWAVEGTPAALGADDTVESRDSVVRPTCPEQRVRVTTPPSLESEASGGGSTNTSGPQPHRSPICQLHSAAEKTRAERTAAGSTTAATRGNGTTVDEVGCSVATSRDDRPLATVHPVVSRTPAVVETNIQLFTKCKILPRRDAYYNMTNYMKTVNRFLNHPHQQTSVENLTKYWMIQNRLFSRFSSGILLDEESFYSVCPEILCRHIASKCQCETIVDPFCGAGGNVIQFTQTCSRVIGIDVDGNKIRLARNNAKVYGVENRIQLKTGDYFRSGRRPKADVVFMSPPWGGPEYINRPVYSFAGMCSEHGGGRRILEIAREIAPKIAIHLPRNVDKHECVQLARELNFTYIQFENNYIGNKLNSTTLYFK